MKERIRLYVVAVSVAAAGARAADRVWQASGDGLWSDPASWSGGVVPLPGDTAVFNNSFSDGAAVVMDGGTGLVSRIKVDNPDGSATRIFVGTQAVKSNEFAKGRAELRGTWTSDTKAITGVGGGGNQTAWLTLSGEAVFAATNQHALYIGNANNSLGRVTVKGNARLSLSTGDTDFGISIGRNSGSVGSFVQEGGLVETRGRFMPGYFGHGAYELLDGVLALPYGDANTRYRFAVQANSTGLFYQRGGELNVTTNALVPAAYHFEIGSGNNNAQAVYYSDGGVARFETQIRLLAGGTSSANPSYAELTVDKAGVIESGSTLYLRSPTTTFSGARSAVNLNRGGTLRVPAVERGTGGRSALNSDGGTLDVVRSSELSSLFGTLPDVVLYEGGMDLAFSGTAGAVMTGTLRGPGGWGVASVAVSAGGSGYLAPPLVTFAGGGGSNASAVAFIDHASGAVTGVVVTCRGEGYAASDALTVGFSGGGGSGGAATATLAENRTGALVKRGAARLVVYAQPDFDGEYEVCEGQFLHSSRDEGSPRVRSVRVSGVGARFQNGSGTAGDNTPAKWDLVNPLATLCLGGDRGGGELQLPCGASDTVYQQHYASLALGFGRSSLTTTGQNATNGAELALGTLSRKPGSALTVTTTTNLSVSVSGAASAFAFGQVRPVVPAVAIGDVTTLTTLENGRLAPLLESDDGFGPESNFWVQASAAADGLAVNSLRLEDAKSLALQAEGVTVINSGVALARAGTAGGSLLSGGTLTSGNGADLILTDFHSAIERRNVSNGKTGLIVGARIVDNGVSPVALFALGRTWDPASQSIATGPCVGLTSASNTYSGGTYILDTALAVAADGSLGAVPAQPTNNLFTSGMAMLRAPAENSTVNLHTNRGIRVCGGGLTFFGDTGLQAGRVLFDVAGDISGEGVLVMNHWTGGGVRSVVQLGGDNRAFGGAVAVHGLLRPTGANGLPPRANLLLCDRGDVSSGGGVVETSGSFTRTPGSEAGQVRWGEVNDVAPGYASNNSGAYGGGFSAYGGPLTVNLGGDRRMLALGVDGFSPARLRLQDDYATDVLTWENPVDVTNSTLLVQVAYLSTGKTAVWRGAVTSSSDTGGGGFTKTGNGTLVLADGANFGPVAFTANNTIKLQVTNRQDLACDMSGSSLLLEKYGVGVTRLAGSNTYANATRIYEGTLLVNGTNTGGGTFTVSAGAVLGGNGRVAPKVGFSVVVDGSLAPGADVGACGTLTVGSAEQASVLTLNGVLKLGLTAETCDRVDVFGDVSVAETATLSVAVTDESLWQARRDEQIPVLTWTGTLTGSLPAPLEALPEGWKLRLSEPDKAVYLSYASPGTMIKVK